MDNSSDDNSLAQNNDKVASLVDYSSSSDDENPALYRKKQRPNDEESDGSSSSDSPGDWETDEDYFGENGDWYEKDSDFLNVGPINHWAVDKWNLPEVYAVFLAGKRRRDKPLCLKLLEKIGCEDRFIGRSVEMRRAFYAKLNKDEAAKIVALKGVHHVIQTRRMVFDI